MGLRSLLCIGSKKRSTQPNEDGPHEMAGLKDNSINYTGVVPSLKEFANFTWKIENFELVLSSAKSKLKSQGTGGGSLGRNCECEIWLGSLIGDQHKVHVKYYLSIVTKGKITMFLCLAEPDKCSLPQVRMGFVVKVSVNGKTKTLGGDDYLRKHINDYKSESWGHIDMLKMSEVKKWLDSHGAITFDVKMVYVVLPQTAVVLKKKKSYMDFITSCEHLQRDVESLIGDQMTSDITIKVLDSEEKLYKSFHAHKAILAARSCVFRAMLCNGETKESQSGVVEVSDVSVETMELFLEFLYKGQFKDNSGWIAQVQKLVYIADKYDVKSLMEVCGDHLIKSVTVENALEMLEFAKRHGLVNAAKDIRDFTVKNIHQVL